MLTAYATCLFAGGVFVVSSAFFGHHDVDHGGLDHGGVDHDVGHDHGAGEHGGEGVWLPFLTLRFWTYAVAFFGLTGVLLEGLKIQTGTVAVGASTGMGLFSGFLASLVMRKLARREVSSLPTALSYVGQPAEVLLDVGPNLPGRVRLSVRGSLIDLPAATDGPETFGRGQTILVLDMGDDGTAKVGKKS